MPGYAKLANFLWDPQPLEIQGYATLWKVMPSYGKSTIYLPRKYTNIKPVALDIQGDWESEASKNAKNVPIGTKNDKI